MIGVVKRRADEIVHRRVHDEKVLFARAFHIFDARDQNACVAGNETARLDQNFQTERLKQRQEPLRVFLRRQNIFCRRRFPPGRRAAGERRLINNAESAADAEKFQREFCLQLFDQRQNFPHRLLKRRRFGDLRTNVHLHAAQPQVFQPAGARIHARDVFKRDAEFIFVGAGGDLRVRVGLDVRIHAHSNGRDFFQPRRDLVDALQFRFALDVEGINIFLQREFNLRPGFAHAGEDALTRVAARRDDPLQFAAADDVETGTKIGQRAQHGEVRVRLHREADEMVERRECLIQLFKMARQRPLRIDIKRRVEFFGERFDGDTFAE